MSDQTAPPRPPLPVAELPAGRSTPIAVGQFGQALEGWLVGNRLVSLAVLLDAADGRQTVILRFTDGYRELDLLVKDRPTSGLALSIASSCLPRYLTDCEVDALLAAHWARRGDGADIEFGVTSAPPQAQTAPPAAAGSETTPPIEKESPRASDPATGETQGN